MDWVRDMVSAAALATIDATGSGDDLELVTFRRQGKPPLRAKCRLLVRQETRDSRWQMSVALWERRDGKFVVACEFPGPEGIGPDAAVVETVEDAFLFLEATCRDLTPWTEPVRTGFWKEPLHGVFARIESGRAFRILVGEALEAWTMPQAFASQIRR